MGDHDWALRDFDEAIKFDSHLAKAYLEKGSLLEAEGNGEEALHCYERFLMYDLPDEDERRYSKDVVRVRAGGADEGSSNRTGVRANPSRCSSLRAITEDSGFNMVSMRRIPDPTRVK